MLFRSAFSVVLGLLPLCALAQGYPTRAMRLIVPYSTGNTDTVSRIFAAKLGEGVGQQVVVDSRPGGAGNIGPELAARAAGDGYTMLVVTTSHAINVSLFRKLGYDLVRDFAPVSQLVSNPFMLTVHPAVQATTVKEVVALARARPGQVNYASSEIGRAHV